MILQDESILNTKLEYVNLLTIMVKVIKYLSAKPNIFISALILAGSIFLLWLTLPGIRTYQQDLQANQIFEGQVTKVFNVEDVQPSATVQNKVKEDLFVDVQINNQVKNVLVHNDFTPLKEGDKIYVRGSQLGQPDESFDIVDYRRQNGIMWLAILFVTLAVAVGGRKGVQAIIGLVFSLTVIFSFIIPRILAGNSPVLIGLAGSLAIVIMNVYLTDGISRKSVAALIGIFITLAFTAGLTVLTVSKLHFSGYTGEDSLYFNQATGNSISLIGILIAGIGLSALGVLADVAITQVSTVLVLARNHKEPTRRKLFLHAMEVGHDHIAAVINTLALAYIGASLPLLLLLNVQKFAIGFTINVEDIATEIIRILISTSALVLVVPITTFVAVLWANKIHDEADSHIH